MSLCFNTIQIDAITRRRNKGIYVFVGKYHWILPGVGITPRTKGLFGARHPFIAEGNKDIKNIDAAVTCGNITHLIKVIKANNELN